MKKHLIIFELFKKLKENNPDYRKIKVFLGVIFLGFIFICGIVVYGGILTIRSISTLSENTKVQEKVYAIGKDIKNIPAIADIGCFDKAKSLLAVKVWIEKPIGDNVTELIQSCFWKNPTNPTNTTNKPNKSI